MGASSPRRRGSSDLAAAAVPVWAPAFAGATNQGSLDAASAGFSCRAAAKMIQYNQPLTILFLESAPARRSGAGGLEEAAIRPLSLPVRACLQATAASALHRPAGREQPRSYKQPRLAGDQCVPRALYFESISLPRSVAGIPESDSDGLAAADGDRHALRLPPAAGFRTRWTAAPRASMRRRARSCRRQPWRGTSRGRLRG